MEDKYLITTEEGTVFYTEDFTTDIVEQFEDGAIFSIIRMSDLSYYASDGNWEQSKEWES